MIAAAPGITEQYPEADWLKPWKDAEQQVNSALPIVFVMEKRAENFHGGFKIMPIFGDPKFSSEPIWKASGMREGFSEMQTTALWRFVSSTCFVKEALEKERS